MVLFIEKPPQSSAMDFLHFSRCIIRVLVACFSKSLYQAKAVPCCVLVSQHVSELTTFVDRPSVCQNLLTNILKLCVSFLNT